MKHLFKTLILVLAGLQVIGQNPFSYRSIDPSSVSSLQRSTVVHQKRDMLQNHSGNSRIIQSIIMDYGFVDEIASVDSGGVQDGFIWDLNSAYPDDSAHHYDLNWAAVTWDTLFDAVELRGYPHQKAQITVDSFGLFYLHDHVTGPNDTDMIILNMWSYEGALGLFIDANDNITGATLLHTDTFFATSSLAPSSGSNYGFLTSAPDLTLPLGERFTTEVRYYGDTANHFFVQATYKDLCFNTCVAEPSIFEDNTFAKTIWWQQGQSVTGVTNFIYFDCDQSGGGAPTPGGCESFYIQNLSMQAYVTIDVPFDVAIQSSDNVVCPGDVVNLCALASGGVWPYTYSWSPLSSLSSPFDRCTDANVTGSNARYIVTVTDSVGNTVSDTINLTLAAINVDAGPDISLSCGEDTCITATVSGQFGPGTTFLWENGSSTLQRCGLGKGNYSITVTNLQGCSDNDQVKIILPGVGQNLSFTVSGLNQGIACVGTPLTFTNTSDVQTGWNWSWDFGDGGTSGTKSPQYIYSGPGSVTVTLNGDSAGCSVPEMSYNFDVEICNSISEVSLTKLIDIYPNPTNGLFKVDFKSLPLEKGSITVMDLQGKVVYQEVISNTTNQVRDIDLIGAAEGLYMVKIQVGQDVVIKKLNVN